MPRVSKYEEHRNQVLTLIQNAAMAHSRPPTVRSLAAELQVGIGTMHSYLGKLAEEGLVEWQPKSHRSVRVTPQAIQRLSLPVAQPR